jgi:chromosomal replication initiator protein
MSSEPVVESRASGAKSATGSESSRNQLSSICALLGGRQAVLSHDELDHTWTEIQRRLRLTIPADVFRVWLEQLRPLALNDGTLYIQTAPRTRDWINRRFGTVLTKALIDTDPSSNKIELVSDPSLVAGAVPTDSSGGRLKPAYSFDAFVMGSSNRFAHAAALAVAELPGQAYNPLFLYGPPGVGKTHLLHAIGNYITLNNPALSVRYATGESFTSQFTNALRTSGVHDFKRSFREIDVLLLDDVQFLESKQKTAEELFYTFDALVDTGAQVVITADRSPSGMPLVEARLRERFQAGLVVDLQPPDFHTRLSILHKRSGPELLQRQQSEALEYLARHVSISVRALEGALIRSRAYASLTQQPLTTELAERVLTTLNSPDRMPELGHAAPTVDHIQKLTSAALKLPVADLSSPKRSRQVVYARQLAMYLCRELTPLSLPAIGQSFGGRDHTSVLYAHRQIRSKIFSDQSTRELVEKLIGGFRSQATSSEKVDR